MNVHNRDQWVVIGISGATCSGKTTLANRLSQALKPVWILHQDKYFYPDDSPKHVKCDNLPHNNYDILSALDMDKMYRDALCVLAGQECGRSCLERGGSSSPLCPPSKSFLVMEGFTALNYKPIYELCDLRYYLVLEYGECAARRAHRLYDPPDIDGYFDQCVWPEHLRYRKMIESDPKVKFLDGTQPDIYESVLKDIQALGTTNS